MNFSISSPYIVELKLQLRAYCDLLTFDPFRFELTVSRNVSGMAEIDVVLDVVGLSCPMPLLKAKQALNKMTAGQQLLVKTTDPGSVRDFKSFTDLSSNQLLENFEEDGCYCYLILKGD